MGKLRKSCKVETESYRKEGVCKELRTTEKGEKTETELGACWGHLALNDGMRLLWD